MTLKLLPPGAAHLERIARKMNPLDVQEVWASGGFTPIESLRQAVQMSYEARVAVVNGDAHAAFGIATFGDNNEVGIPWLLATPEIKTWGRQFLRVSEQFVQRWLRSHEVLTNAVDVRHHEAHKWLHWLGFEVTQVHPQFGVGKMPFLQFELCANPQASS
jgi:hypothetical protein